MADMGKEESMEITVEAITPTSFVSKSGPRAGQNVPKYEVQGGGQLFSKIGQPPKDLAVGDKVVVKYAMNGRFANITDILKNGATILAPKFGGFGRPAAAANPKPYLILAATLLACHNKTHTAAQQIQPDDLDVYISELEKKL